MESVNNSRNNDNSPSSASSSSSSSSSPDFQLYSERPEWSDIKGLPQNDGPYPIVSIAYGERFRDTFDYFRAILANDEMSERALQLTTDCASLNPSNYTIWYFRRKVITALKRDLYGELRYIEEVIREHPKNYQVWHHRKCIVEMIKKSIDNANDSVSGDGPSNICTEIILNEKNFIEYMISQDAKNYHAWQHRQWMVSEFNAYDGELKNTDELIDSDIRNNSAWNHRYFIVSRGSKSIDDDVLELEIEFTCHKIELAPNNESSWNYLRGILGPKGLNGHSRVKQMCDDLNRNSDMKSPYLLGFMIDQIEEILLGQENPDKVMLQKALELCEELANRRDRIRKEYWNFIARELKNNYDDND